MQVINDTRWKAATAYRMTPTAGNLIPWLTWTPGIQPGGTLTREPVEMMVRDDCEVKGGPLGMEYSWFCYCPSQHGPYTIPMTVSQALAKGVARFIEAVL